MLHPIPAWLTIDVILVSLFPFVGGILSMYSEIFLDKKRSKARLRRHLIVFGSLLSIFGALLGSVLQGRDSYNLWAFSTGAEDYCYVVYTFRTNNALKFIGMHDGEYPLFDVSMNIRNYTLWTQLGGAPHSFAGQPPLPSIERDLELENKVSVQVHIGNVRPRQGFYVWDAPIPSDSLQIYYFIISARNSNIEEEVLLRKKDDGSFVSAMRVWKSTGDVVKGWPQFSVVREDIPEDFRKYYPNGVPWTLNLN
ncbi:MAG TPA: hypothetical protein VFI38_09810 [Candidatus Acidoferrum sp.]|nr:hypothetical protein [Candidatus Acidoferrum sp.]